MTNYYVTYTFKDQNDRDSFYKELVENGVEDASRAEEGCITYKYFFYADVNNKIFIWEQWASRDAWLKHKTFPHFDILLALKEKYQVESDIIVEDQIVS